MARPSGDQEGHVMGLFKKNSERDAAIEAHRQARENLARVSSKTRDVNDEYLEANRRVIDAEQGVPWWRR